MSNFSVDELRDATVYDRKGGELGKVDKIFLDSKTDKPNFITVKTSRGKERVLPTSFAELDDDALRVPFDKATLDKAPGVDTDEELVSSDQDEIVKYFESIDISDDDDDDDDSEDRPSAKQADAKSEDSDREESEEGVEEEGTMIRRAEKLEVGTEWEETGETRLRKRVVTTTETVEVPLQREELVIEREPLSDDEAQEGGDLSEHEEVIVLREERPVVEKEVVGVEKVTVGKRTVSKTETVSAEVQEEQIEIDEGEKDDDR